MPNWFAKPNQFNQCFRWPITNSKLVNRLRPSTLPVPSDPAPATLPRSLLLSWSVCAINWSPNTPLVHARMQGVPAEGHRSIHRLHWTGLEPQGAALVRVLFV